MLMEIDTRSSPFFLTNPGGNVTAASITLPVPQQARPSGDGIFDMGGGGVAFASGGKAAPGFMLVPFGTGISGNTFSMDVFGWRNTTGANGLLQEWIPTVLATFTCTLCATTGVAGCDVNASQLFCDTISLTLGNPNVSNEILTPSGLNIIAHIVMDGKGSTLIGVYFGTGGSATSCNCLATRI